MKKQSIFLYVLRLALTLLLITGCMAAALAGVNMLTKDRIAAITKEKTDKAIQEVLPGAKDVMETSFSDPSGLVRTVYYTSEGFAVEVVPSGFDGEITMMVGVTDRCEVLGVSIISHTETAGLGAVAAANTSKGETFRNQFVGTKGGVAVTKDGGEIDAITGATITSRAIVEGVNAAVSCVGQYTGG